MDTMDNGQTPQEYFRLVLLTVVGQAFDAAGYTLENCPAQWAGGHFRFAKHFGGVIRGFIEWQHLHYTEGRPSLFRVTLTRTDKLNPMDASTHPRYAQRLLAALVVDDFKVQIVPSGSHWWKYTNTSELGRALGEAGSLAIAYGIPWLSGELVPP